MSAAACERLLILDQARPANQLTDDMRWAQRCGFHGFGVGDRVVRFDPYVPTRSNENASDPIFAAYFDLALDDIVVRCHQVGTRADGTACHAACDEHLSRRTDAIGEVLADLEARVAECLRT